MQFKDGKDEPFLVNLDMIQTIRTGTENGSGKEGTVFFISGYEQGMFINMSMSDVTAMILEGDLHTSMQ